MCQVLNCENTIVCVLASLSYNCYLVTGEGSHRNNTQSCSSVVDRGRPHNLGGGVGWGCQVIIRQAIPCTTVDTVLGECHGLVSYTRKTSFLHFEKGDVKCITWRPYPALHTVPVAVKSCWPGWPHPFVHFFLVLIYK
jgi:hypothetical protein